jgi:hypothetical protein
LICRWTAVAWLSLWHFFCVCCASCSPPWCDIVCTGWLAAIVRCSPLLATQLCCSSRAVQLSFPRSTLLATNLRLFPVSCSLLMIRCGSSRVASSAQSAISARSLPPAKDSSVSTASADPLTSSAQSWPWPASLERRPALASGPVVSCVDGGFSGCWIAPGVRRFGI